MSSSAQTRLDFGVLEPHQPRTFVPKDADLTNVDQVKGLYQQLIDREIIDSQDLEAWINHRSELEAALHETGSILYIRMTCQTDDQERAERYQKFVETIQPAVRPLEDNLNRKLIELQKSFPLSEQRYGIYIREIQEDINLFRQENVPLQTQEQLLSQQYQKVSGSMTVQFDGEEYTLPQMSKFLLKPERDIRERAWRAVAERRLQDKEKLNDIFDQMIKLRVRIAQNAGCGNYMDYKFKALHRFDYTPDDCRQYHASVKECLAPIWREILQRRRSDMKLDALRPWDTSCDELGRAPLKPFDTASELVDGCRRIFAKVAPRFGDHFQMMSDNGLLDLESRKGKAPGGYQSALDEARKPFIFMNSVGVDGDVRTLLHEGGHAFHSIACSHHPLIDYRHGPMEFNEVASMAMELLGGEFIDEFYTHAEDAARSRKEHIDSTVFVLLWVAVVDAFQQWIYQNPEHTREERDAKWVELHEEYGGGVVDWSGLEDVRRSLWHRQLHIFEVPFYYIEYGIAQLGALQLWKNSKSDWNTAVRKYQEAMALGGSRPLPEIYQAAGIRFDFSKETIAPLAELLKRELKSL